MEAGAAAEVPVAFVYSDTAEVMFEFKRSWL